MPSMAAQRQLRAKSWRLVALDTFTRTVTDGLGAAERGGTYTVGGTPTLFDVNGSAAQLQLEAINVTQRARLADLKLRDVDMRITWQLNQAPAGTAGIRVYLTARMNPQNADNDMLRLSTICRQTGQYALEIERVAGGTGNAVISGSDLGVLSIATNYTMRFQVLGGIGGTVVRGKIWLTSTAEPQAWTIESTTAEDAANQQVAGNVGFRGFAGTGATIDTTTNRKVFTLDDFSVYALL